MTGSSGAYGKVKLVVAWDQRRGIGKNGQMPWHLPKELAWFRKLTRSATLGKNAVVMGRKTWQALPAKNRPLPGRLNVVVSRQLPPQHSSRLITLPSLEEALRLAADQCQSVFIIGGAQLYEAVLKKTVKLPHSIYSTEIEKDFNCDVFFPAFEEKSYVVHHLFNGQENGINYRVNQYRYRG